MDACPAESTKRSRLGHETLSGLNLSTRCHSVYATGANAMGVPGWPELAAWTASIDSVRIVFMASWPIELAFGPSMLGSTSIRRLGVGTVRIAGGDGKHGM